MITECNSGTTMEAAHACPQPFPAHDDHLRVATSKTLKPSVLPEQ